MREEKRKEHEKEIDCRCLLRPQPCISIRGHSASFFCSKRPPPCTCSCPLNHALLLRSLLHHHLRYSHPQLLLAIADCIRALVAAGADVNATNRITGATPLHCAVLTGKCTPQQRLETTTILLGAGANPTKGDFFGSTPLDYLEEDDPNEPGIEALKDLLTPAKPTVFKAIDEVNVDKVKSCLEKQKDLVGALYRNNTPLLKAIELILEEDDGEEGGGSGLDGQQRIERDKKLVEIVRLLVENGSDPNLVLPGRRGDQMMSEAEPEDPPFHHVCLALKQAITAKETERIVILEVVGRLLKRAGAVPTEPTIQLLHDAARRNLISMADFLIRTGSVDPNSKGRQGMTPLHFAARSGKKDMTEFLLNNFPMDTSVTDDRGKTALDAAKANNKEEIIALLEDYDKKKKEASS